VMILSDAIPLSFFLSRLSIRSDLTKRNEQWVALGLLKFIVRASPWSEQNSTPT